MMKKKKCLLLGVILFASSQFLFAQNYDVNYDESKVGTYSLPELLITQSGEKVSTVKQWEKVRRPEILKLFENNEYGKVPSDFDKITFKIENQDNNAMEGLATLKQVAVTVFRNNNSLTIHLVLFIPNKVKKEVPVFLVINHRGMRTMDVTRNNKDGFWPAEQVISAGYAIAGFDVTDVSPDNNKTFSKGVLDQLYPEQLKMNNGMRCLGAWGWGASRIIDYFETDKAIDAKKIIVLGHSRGGKASLWCGAQDQRIAITISNESGNSGAALSRRNFGETIDKIMIASRWFCPNYRKYANNEDNLPFDQHMLIALIAPRAVYVATAADDLWGDSKGQYLGLKYAQPVYNLYGCNCNLPEGMPDASTFICSAMGFHNRVGKHNMTPYDWQQFIRFANNYFKEK